MSARDDQALLDYLGHIREAIAKIQRYVNDLDHAGFLQNEEKQDAVIRNLEVIGEACGNILKHFPDFSGQFPGVPLREAYGTRNMLAHGYFKVDLDIVWRTIEVDLPSLDMSVERALAALTA